MIQELSKWANLTQSTNLVGCSWAGSPKLKNFKNKKLKKAMGEPDSPRVDSQKTVGCNLLGQIWLGVWWIYFFTTWLIKNPVGCGLTHRFKLILIILNATMSVWLVWPFHECNNNFAISTTKDTLYGK